MEKAITSLYGLRPEDLKALRVIDKIQNDESITPTQFDTVWNLITKKDRNKVTAKQTWYEMSVDNIRPYKQDIPGWHRFGVFCSFAENLGRDKCIEYWSFRQNRINRIYMDDKRHIYVN